MDHDLIIILTESEARYRRYAEAWFNDAGDIGRRRPEFTKTRAEWLRLADKCAALISEARVPA